MSYTLIGKQLRIDKDPQDIARYGVDMVDRLAPGDTVAGCSIASQAGITADQAAVSGSVALCRVSGGTVGQPASVTLGITTAQGDFFHRTINFDLVQR